MVLIDWKQDRAPVFKMAHPAGIPNIKCLEGGIDLWSEKIDTRLNRYDIDEDDGYRYEDILENPMITKATTTIIQRNNFIPGLWILNLQIHY
ncbi:MAG: hypothetical protein Ct9H300mP23_08620 [Nitrospinota bacterium]|nr:MAG: hypothetical protein Ct9H300mP23_08620 [Nitrospinota bacterium]